MLILYTDKELSELKGKDPVLSEFIDRIGRIEREAKSDIFEALSESIVSQQVSNKAYATVTKRLHDLCGNPLTPDGILKADREDIKSCGMSYKKTDWIINIAQSVKDGTFDIESLKSLSDDEVIKKLSSLPGIGKWTAEMLLIFALGRKDVLSFGDFGIRSGIMKTYKLQSLSKEEFNEIKSRLSPHNTLASLYFWEIASKY